MIPPQGSGASLNQIIADLNPSLFIPRRANSGQILFVENFKNCATGMYNDGVGSASRDNEITFAGLPTVRLDPQGNTTSNTDPGNSPDNSGVVFKRRINHFVGLNGAGGIYGVEHWMRFTSDNNTANIFYSTSLYNRDGTNFYMSRFWIDPTVNPVSLKILTSAGTWKQIGTYGNPTPYVAQHLYNPLTLTPARYDRAGLWNYAKLVTDLTNLKYVYVQFNELVFPLSDAMFQAASSGAATMHFSVEYAQKTSTRRFVNVANVVGTSEG